MADRKNKTCILCGSNTDLSIRGRWHLIMKIMNKIPNKYFVPIELLRMMISFIPEHTCISVDSKLELCGVMYTCRYTNYLQNRVPFMTIRNNMSYMGANKLTDCQYIKRVSRWTEWSRCRNILQSSIRQKTFSESVADAMIGFKLPDKLKDKIADIMNYYNAKKSSDDYRLIYYKRVTYGYGVHRKTAPRYDEIRFDTDWTMEEMSNPPKTPYSHIIDVRRDTSGQQWVKASNIWNIVGGCKRGGPSMSLKAATTPPRIYALYFYTTMLKKDEDYKYNCEIEWSRIYPVVGPLTYFVKLEAIPIWLQNSTYLIAQKLGTYLQILIFKE